ncbi:MAG: acetyltransferase-like isoleucine patch superfamily enzyme [Luteibaculaceae bacterium]|jgi:acetyltransferase-like isoleucine patch superfamily enzyme
MGLKAVLDRSVGKWLVQKMYPQYHRPIQGYQTFFGLLKRYWFFQKILRINAHVPWPVDFRSKVIHPEKIQKGVICEPGDSPGMYVNAAGGIILGNNIEFGPNVVLSSVNHSKYDFREVGAKKGIEIGDNVWIGANAVITAGSKIGSNVVVGAGVVIRGVVPDNCTVVPKEREFEIIPHKEGFRYDFRKDNLS